MDARTIFAEMARHKKTIPKHIKLLIKQWFPAICHLCSAQASGPLCNDCSDILPRNDGPRCSVCDVPQVHQAALCRDCLAKPPSFDRVITGWRYDPPMSDLIHRLKDRHEHFWIHTLSEQLIEHIEELPDLIVPTPIHWSRRIVRGFNQSQLIAQTLSRRLNRPSLALLAKHTRTVAQKSLSRKKRQQNLKSSFTCNGNVRGKHIALVDDVVTTGATIEVLARLLKDHGASRVDIWALARTPSPHLKPTSTTKAAH